MTTNNARTSIPIHHSTLQAFRGVKTADQTWDDSLLALADDYLSPSLRRELDRRIATEEIIPGATMMREYSRWRRRRGQGTVG